MITWLENHMLPCAYKTLLGIDCPICGFQRAFILLLQGRFMDSFKMYPPLIPCMLFICMASIYCTRKSLIKPEFFNFSALFTLSIVFINYFIKMAVLIFSN